jgi:hypothetical protein
MLRYEKNNENEVGALSVPQHSRVNLAIPEPQIVGNTSHCVLFLTISIYCIMENQLDKRRGRSLNNI